MRGYGHLKKEALSRKVRWDGPFEESVGKSRGQDPDPRATFPCELSPKLQARTKHAELSPILAHENHRF